MEEVLKALRFTLYEQGERRLDALVFLAEKMEAKNLVQAEKAGQAEFDL